MFKGASFFSDSVPPVSLRSLSRWDGVCRPGALHPGPVAPRRGAQQRLLPTPPVQLHPVRCRRAGLRGEEGGGDGDVLRSVQGESAVFEMSSKSPKWRLREWPRKAANLSMLLLWKAINWLWSCSWCSTMRSSWKTSLRSWSRKLEPCSSLRSRSTCASCPEPDEGAAERQQNASSLPLDQPSPV